MEPAALLVAIRRRQGLTQAELARRAGTSQPVVSAYERGHRDPTYRTLHRLVAAGGERLRLVAEPASSELALDPPADLEEHGRRLVDVLSLADAIPQRRRARHRPGVLDAPRLVSR